MPLQGINRGSIPLSSTKFVLMENIMSEICTLLSNIDVECPYCEEILEIDNVDISITVDNYDIIRYKDECKFDFVCPCCENTFYINPVGNIEITKF